MKMDLIDLSNEKNYLVVVKPVNEPTIEELLMVPTFHKIKAGLNGGLLEIVPYFNKFMGRPCVAFVDEEGKMKNLTPNRTAQLLWEKAYGGPILEDYLVGNVVIVIGSPEFLAQL
jgi:hypothetical protein